jgi:hypothetical protein
MPPGSGNLVLGVLRRDHRGPAQHPAAARPLEAARRPPHEQEHEAMVQAELAKLNS